MIARGLLLLLLGTLVGTGALDRFARTPGIDFYQLWGVAQARREAGGELGSPYLEPAQYAAVLDAYARRSADLRLRAASQQRATLDLTATPLLLACFALLPSHYSFAFGAFQALQILLFAGAVLAVGRASRAPPFVTAILALVLLAVYQPFVSDLRVGNVNALQLFALVALVGLAARGRSGALLLSGLVFLTLAKPNVAGVSFLLLAHLWATKGGRSTLRAALPAAGAGAALVAISSLYFDSWSVWSEWLRTVFIADPARLVYPIAEGNYATPLLVASALGIDARVAMLGIAVSIALPALGVAWFRRVPRASGFASAAQAVRCALSDPWRAASVGILATLSLAPLVWAHYFVLALLPALWLLFGPSHGKGAALLGATGVVLASAVIPFGLLPDGAAALVPFGVAAACLPLWAGVLAAPLPPSPV